MRYPKVTILTGRDNWWHWSLVTTLYLACEGIDGPLFEDSPLNLHDKDEVEKTALVRAELAAGKEMEPDQITAEAVLKAKTKILKRLNAEYDDWMAANAMAVSRIYFTCSPEIQATLNTHRLAKRAWEALKNAYSIADFVSIEVELNKLHSLSSSNTKSVRHLVDSIETSRNHLIFLGENISDHQCTVILLRGLPPSFASFARNIRQRDLSKIKFDEIASQAIADELEDLRLQQRHAVY